MKTVLSNSYYKFGYNRVPFKMKSIEIINIYKKIVFISIILIDPLSIILINIILKCIKEL